MSKKITSAEPAAGPSLQERVNQLVLFLAREGRACPLAVALFVLGTGVMLMYRPQNHVSVGDSAGYDYIAQSILRGQIPYRDVVDIKAPGSMYLSAFAMAAGKLLGVRDIIAVRLFQALLVGFLSVVIFFVTRIYFRSTMAALIASVFPLTSYTFADWMIVGTQPKLPMILFGMLSLLFIGKDKPFWAGVTSMLACLCWQPGLMFTGGAFLMFSRYLTSWRDWRAVKVLAGAVAPLAITFAYFYSRGALGDLWAWTITYNYSVFRPENQRTPVRALTHLSSVTSKKFGAAIVVVWISIVGFLALGIERVRLKLNRKGASDLFRDAILIPPIVYFAFCIINMQGGPDLIPFLPFIGMFAAWFLVQLGRFISSRSTRGTDAAGIRWDLLVPGTALVLMLFLALESPLMNKNPAGHTLQDQDARLKGISDLLTPDDKIYVQGSVELLVLLNRPNLNPYTFLNQGIDRFASARRLGDFNLILGEMEFHRPKLVALSRLKTVSSRDLLERWVDEHYDKLKSFTDSDVYIRKAP